MCPHRPLRPPSPETRIWRRQNLRKAEARQAASGGVGSPVVSSRLLRSSRLRSMEADAGRRTLVPVTGRLVEHAWTSMPVMRDKKLPSDSKTFLSVRRSIGCLSGSSGVGSLRTDRWTGRWAQEDGGLASLPSECPVARPSLEKADNRANACVTPTLVQRLSRNCRLGLHVFFIDTQVERFCGCYGVILHCFHCNHCLGL
ncbi:hypothetical protein C8Q78DRAFT_140327 [Trametes maxima]|nr:hypothetical protein C8Q78DRAFT_140327 [Trametes maxima]